MVLFNYAITSVSCSCGHQAFNSNETEELIRSNFVTTVDSATNNIEAYQLVTARFIITRVYMLFTEESFVNQVFIRVTRVNNLWQDTFANQKTLLPSHFLRKEKMAYFLPSHDFVVQLLHFASAKLVLRIIILTAYGLQILTRW